MKKVMLAILVAAVREKTPCQISVNTTGGSFQTVPTTGVSLNWAGQVNSFDLEVTDTVSGRVVGTMNLTPNPSELEVGARQINGMYQLMAGQFHIAFLSPFKQDPFETTI
jgi:hypothetical protein